MRKKMIALLALLVLATGLCGRVWAAELPDLDRLGSIMFLMDFDGTPLDGGSLTLYRVGDVVENDGNYSFACVPGIVAVSLENLNDPALAADLADAAKNAGLEAIPAPIEDGRAVFSDLEPGLYVVSQRPGGETPGYAAIDPFLISLPQWQDGAYVYDLTADPKVPLAPAPTEPTSSTEPSEPPDLPQTGQLNWPVPLMAALGLAFFGLGWLLFFGSKRRGA